MAYVEINLDGTGKGTILIDGVDVAPMTRALHIGARRDNQVAVRLAMVSTAGIRAHLKDAHVEVSGEELFSQIAEMARAHAVEHPGCAKTMGYIAARCMDGGADE